MMRACDGGQTSISIDLKKYRIRVHKGMLHLLGDPGYIQLLVNPDKMMVVIRSLDHELSGDQSHKVNQKQMRSDNSVEFYSRSFVSKLRSVMGNAAEGWSYRIAGTVFPSQCIAVFHLEDRKQITQDEVL